jgi:hypothetical protein
MPWFDMPTTGEVLAAAPHPSPLPMKYGERKCGCPPQFSPDLIRAGHDVSWEQRHPPQPSFPRKRESSPALQRNMRGWIPDSLARLGFGDDGRGQRRHPPQPSFPRKRESNPELQCDMRGWIPDSLAPLGFGDDVRWEHRHPSRTSSRRRAKDKAGIQVTGGCFSLDQHGPGDLPIPAKCDERHHPLAARISSSSS